MSGSCITKIGRGISLDVTQKTSLRRYGFRIPMMPVHPHGWHPLFHLCGIKQGHLSKNKFLRRGIRADSRKCEPDSFSV